MRGLVTAIRTLSILPVPGSDADDLSYSLPWFPFVGLLLGLVVYGAGACVEWAVGEWHQLTAASILLAGIVVTRGLHMDGLADLGDAFWGTNSRERTLEIMKDSAVGTFGALALILTCLIKLVAIVRLLQFSSPSWIVVAYVLSRTMQVDLASSLPYARSDGGTASEFVDGAERKQAFAAIISALILVLVLQGMSGAWVLVGGWAVARIFGLWCNKRLGGVTGDLLGACSEIVETAVLIMGAVLSGGIA